MEAAMLRRTVFHSELPWSLRKMRFEAVCCSAVPPKEGPSTSIFSDSTIARRTTPIFPTFGMSTDPRRLCRDDLSIYYQRRSEKMSELAKKIPPIYTDLSAILRETRGYTESEPYGEEILCDSSFDTIEDVPPSLSDLQSRDKAMEGVKDAMVIPELPLFFIDGKGNLHVPADTQIAFDTCLLVYLPQVEVDKFKSKAESVYRLLMVCPCLPIVSEIVISELHGVLMSDRVELKGIVGRKSVAENKYISAKDISNNRLVRLRALESVLSFLGCIGFVQSEEGRGSYVNLFRLVKESNLKPFDCKVLVDSASDDCHILFTEDSKMKHNKVYTCVKDGVGVRVLVWHPLSHGLFLYPRCTD